MAREIITRDNRWGYMVKDNFVHVSNFVFRLVYSVESDIGPGFIVDLTRADGVNGDTQSFLTQSFSASTLPFVWDDPTSRSEVKQVAVDLANGAARGKANGRTLPMTACLVTANFDLREEEKYHSRLFVVPFKKIEITPRPGVYHSMTMQAKAASSAFLLLARETKKISVEKLNEQTKFILSAIPDIDIRVAEGISLPTLICQKMLEAVGCQEYLQRLTNYIEEDLAGYHKEVNSTKLPAADISNFLLMMKDMDDLSDCVRVTGDNIIIDKTRAASYLSIDASEVIMAIRKVPGAVVNKAGRLHGKVKKVAKIPLQAIAHETLQALKLVLPESDGNKDHEPQPPSPPNVEFDHMTIQDDDEEPPLPPPPADYGCDAVLEDSNTCLPPPPTELSDVDCIEMDGEIADSNTCLPPPPTELSDVDCIEMDGEIAEHLPMPPSTISPSPSPKHHELSASPAEPSQPLPVRPQTPGQEVKHDQDVCASCSKRGHKGWRWILCDGCKQWYHRKCTSLTDREYRKHVKDNSKPWFCCSCL